MKEFASAAMIRILLLGLRRQGIVPLAAPNTDKAHVPISDKRALLGGVVERHGPLALLRASDGIAYLPMEPLLRVLVSARGVEDLLDRWRRLERFAHSKHRVTFSSPEPGLTIMDHVAPGHDERPSWIEDLVVYGVLINLCEMIGAGDVTAGPVSPSGDHLPWRAEGTWRHPDPAMRDRPWAISWAPARGEDVSEPPPRDPASVTARVRAEVRQDPARRWRVEDMAQRLAMSVRGLQRHLGAEGTTLTRTVLDERLEQATRLMAETEADIAQIGFVCGFSDQAHFSRLFKRATGITPAAYGKILRNPA